MVGKAVEAAGQVFDLLQNVVSLFGDSDDDDDFMPSSKERRVEALSKKAEASSKGKGKKAESSSKGKGGNTTDGAGCIDGR